MSIRFMRAIALGTLISLSAGAVYAARPQPIIERVDPERQHRPALALGLRKLRAKRG